MTRHIATIATLLLGFIAVPASSASAPAALLPLSDADTSRIGESGCNFSFDIGRKTYVFAINHTLMVRTSAGLSLCKLPVTQFDKFSEASGSVTCGGRKLTLRRTGKGTSSEEADSASFPATLTVTAGAGAPRLLRGMAGTAC
jgi:hypothetical protein